MNEALCWVGFIAESWRTVLLRALVDPASDRHLYNWRRIGGVLGCSHRAAEVWHG